MFRESNVCHSNLVLSLILGRASLQREGGKTNKNIETKFQTSKMITNCDRPRATDLTKHLQEYNVKAEKESSVKTMDTFPVIT